MEPKTYNEIHQELLDYYQADRKNLFWPTVQDACSTEPEISKLFNELNMSGLGAIQTTKLKKYKLFVNLLHDFTFKK